MLAQRDYDNVSIAELGRASGCAVGSFYVRFKDKTAFLSLISRVTFQQSSAQFEQAMDNMMKSSRSGRSVAEGLANHFIDQFANAEFAGVLRATIKLGFSDVTLRSPFDRYRDTIVLRLRNMFSDGLEPDALEELTNRLRIVLSALTDNALITDPEVRLDPTELAATLPRFLSDGLAKGLRVTTPRPAREVHSPDLEDVVPTGTRKRVRKI